MTKTQWFLLVLGLGMLGGCAGIDSVEEESLPTASYALSEEEQAQLAQDERNRECRKNPNRACVLTVLATDDLCQWQGLTCWARQWLDEDTARLAVTFGPDSRRSQWTQGAEQVPFTRWSDVRGKRTAANAMNVTVSFQMVPLNEALYGSWGSHMNVTDVYFTPELFWRDHPPVEYDADGRLVYSGIFARIATTDLAGVGHAGVDVGGYAPEKTGYREYTQSHFASVRAGKIGMQANPYALGWDYQSFGAWEEAGSSGGYVASESFGAPTPGAAVPTTGSAEFTGKLGGFYVSPGGLGSMAAADLRVSADFATRTLGFATTGTVTTRDLATPTAASNLDLSGRLSYAPGSGNFSGALTNASGTMSGSTQGRFYGPAAEELGGIFALRSASTRETFTGAYGAKR